MLKPSQPRQSRQEAPDGKGGVSLDDFYAYMPMHSYLIVPHFLFS